MLSMGKEQNNIVLCFVVVVVVAWRQSKACIVDAGGRQEAGINTSEDDPTKNALPMTTNATTLNSYLEETGRYSVVEEKTDEDVTYTMTITGELSGNELGLSVLEARVLRDLAHINEQTLILKWGWFMRQ